MASWKYPGVNDERRGLIPMGTKAADYTVLKGDNGTTFVTTAATNYTLPAVANVENGWHARFFNAADANMTITAPSGKLIVFNNVAATSIAFSTASEKAGAAVEIVYSSAAAAYIAFVMLGAETQTPTIA